MAGMAADTAVVTVDMAATVVDMVVVTEEGMAGTVVAADMVVDPAVDGAAADTVAAPAADGAAADTAAVQAADGVAVADTAVIAAVSEQSTHVGAACLRSSTPRRCARWWRIARQHLALSSTQ